ncbi:hypothetical protein [Halobaculum magnesiiphilum]|uniref:Uncharacterized protein n=1 Tax=Halobaculum magnesiiphilum TaxID=1017351 RepID=A0A8T8WIN0_9EURY|nr:hypothetical protein [Halobaculum magnesiiphilum]QZP39584.1 hypothetical protein K6T50_18650 [Halobaculum magnesiiphilum]
MSDDTRTSRRVPKRWLDVLELAIDEGIEREGGVTLSAEDLRVEVPLAFGDDADRAEWGFDGSVTVETDGTRGTLAEWYHLHRESLPDPHGDTDRIAAPNDGGD